MNPVSNSTPAPARYDDLARRIDHALLQPEWTDEEVAEACRRALEWGIGCVTVRPCDVDFVVRQLSGTSLVVASTVGYPDGCQTTAVKLFEARDLLRRGAKELEASLNVGQLCSRHFQHLETELLQMARAAAESGALLKVSLDHPALAEDLKVIAMKICKRCDVSHVAVAAGDVPLAARILKDVCRIKVSSGIEGLNEALAVVAAGADRLAPSSSGDLLAAWRVRLQAAQAAQDA